MSRMWISGGSQTGPKGAAERQGEKVMSPEEGLEPSTLRFTGKSLTR